MSYVCFIYECRIHNLQNIYEIIVYYGTKAFMQ